MAIKKNDSGWLVDIQLGGKETRRYRKTLPTKAEALAYEAWLTTRVIQAPESALPKRDLRKLSDLVEVWQNHHGVNLRSTNNSQLRNLCEVLGDPVVDQFKPKIFAEYRTKRLAEGLRQTI